MPETLRWVVLTGSRRTRDDPDWRSQPLDGFHAHGPFSSREEAEAFAAGLPTASGWDEFEHAVIEMLPPVNP